MEYKLNRKVPKRLAIYITDELHAKVKAAAASKQMSLTEYTLRALLEQLNKGKDD